MAAARMPDRIMARLAARMCFESTNSKPASQPSSRGGAVLRFSSGGESCDVYSPPFSPPYVVFLGASGLVDCMEDLLMDSAAQAPALKGAGVKSTIAGLLGKVRPPSTWHVALTKLARELMEQVLAHPELAGQREWIFAGHGRGGALALYAAAYAESQRRSAMGVITFGSAPAAAEFRGPKERTYHFLSTHDALANAVLHGGKLSQSGACITLESFGSFYEILRNHSMASYTAAVCKLVQLFEERQDEPASAPAGARAQPSSSSRPLPATENPALARPGLPNVGGSESPANRRRGWRLPFGGSDRDNTPAEPSPAASPKGGRSPAAGGLASPPGNGSAWEMRSPPVTAKFVSKTVAYNSCYN